MPSLRITHKRSFNCVLTLIIRRLNPVCLMWTRQESGESNASRVVRSLYNWDLSKRLRFGERPIAPIQFKNDPLNTTWGEPESASQASLKEQWQGSFVESGRWTPTRPVGSVKMCLKLRLSVFLTTPLRQFSRSRIHKLQARLLVNTRFFRYEVY